MQIPALLSAFYGHAASDAVDQRSKSNERFDQVATNKELALLHRVRTMENKSTAEDLVAIVGGIEKGIEVSAPFLPSDVAEGLGRLNGKGSELAQSNLESAAAQDGVQAAIVSVLGAGGDQVAQQSPAEHLAEVIAQVA